MVLNLGCSSDKSLYWFSAQAWCHCVFHKRRFDIAHFQACSAWISEGSWEGSQQPWARCGGTGQAPILSPMLSSASSRYRREMGWGYVGGWPSPHSCHFPPCPWFDDFLYEAFSVPEPEIRRNGVRLQVPLPGMAVWTAAVWGLLGVPGSLGQLSRRPPPPSEQHFVGSW